MPTHSSNNSSSSSNNSSMLHATQAAEAAHLHGMQVRKLITHTPCDSQANNASTLPPTKTAAESRIQEQQQQQQQQQHPKCSCNITTS